MRGAHTREKKKRGVYTLSEGDGKKVREIDENIFILFYFHPLLLLNPFLLFLTARIVNMQLHRQFRYKITTFVFVFFFSFFSFQTHPSLNKDNK